ncbi:MAG: hypothetical protein R6V19_17370 [Armatimonadota bacterium]
MPFPRSYHRPDLSSLTNKEQLTQPGLRKREQPGLGVTPGHQTVASQTRHLPREYFPDKVAVLMYSSFILATRASAIALTDAERAALGAVVRGRRNQHRYDEASDARILANLDDPPPEGYACWNGRLLAGVLTSRPIRSGRRFGGTEGWPKSLR